jgi:phosphatidylinositol alpha-1,6-mannosyltransferase
MIHARGARTPKGAEPGPEHGEGGRLLFVSAGLSPRGGGIAAAGRLLLGATRDWAADRDVTLRMLTLGEADDIPTGVEGEAFAGNRGALARAVWRSQLLEGFRHHVYDFLGVARIQGVLPRRMRARYLLYLHGIECWTRLRRDRRTAVAGAASVLANSSWTLDRLRRSNPWCEKGHVLPLAVGVAADSATADPRVLAQAGEGFVLIVGRLASTERYKGHEALIDAVAMLANERAPLRLVVTGEGEDRARLAAHAAALGVDDRVCFTGFVDASTLAALYERCSVFAMPSDGEGFGLVYLEAMRAAKPCVALADSAAAAEIIIEGVTGCLVEPGVESLSSTLRELLTNPAAAARLGAAGRERWERDFTPPVFAGRFETHLDALLGAALEPSGVGAGPVPARPFPTAL